MRACFLGQNICGLGFGIATLRTPALVMDQPVPESPPQPDPAEGALTVGQHVSLDGAFGDTQVVANSQRRAGWSKNVRPSFNYNRDGYCAQPQGQSAAGDEIGVPLVRPGGNTDISR